MNVTRTYRFRRLLFQAIKSTPRARFSQTVDKSAVLPDGQLRYSTNKKWHAAMNFVPKPRDIPSYQYPVIIASAGVCLIYFCLLREENDLDRILAGEITVEDMLKPS
ncbi:hypothetical protein CSKR_200692 [Clonorchis sinensis]|uniref:Uncharacterized protein n=1 Tax=Clonorchis sinensis TaxID=79923 RepID=A0A8T1MHI8_CLOSI|nr:hypothetical protein CSKR_200692 [Clonorchis sinensis]